MKPFVVVMVFAALALARDKPKDSDYQPATLLSFRTVDSGQSCSGSVNGNVDDSGNIQGTTDSSCRQRTKRIYKIRMGEQTLEIERFLTGKEMIRGMATLGWGDKGSVLRDQLPGAHIDVRSDPSGFYVRVGKKESKFKIVSAN